jgi:hypothetical protein
VRKVFVIRRQESQRGMGKPDTAPARRTAVLAGHSGKPLVAPLTPYLRRSSYISISVPSLGEVAECTESLTSPQQLISRTRSTSVPFLVY